MTQSNLNRWLIGSVVLNIFLLGAVAGGAWRWWQADRAAAAAPPAAAAPATRTLRNAADELAPDQRQAFRARLREARREAASSLQAARAGRQEMRVLLAAPAFDTAAAAAALARIREADAATRARYEAEVVAFAATLPPADRIKLAEGLARRGAANAATGSRPARVQQEQERP